MNGKILKIIFLGISSLGTLGAATFMSANNIASPSNSRSSYEATKKAEPVIETKKAQATEEIQFETVYQDDATIAKDKTIVAVEGENGVRTVTYEVTYTDGVETSRTRVAEEITAQPVTKVVKRGTYVASTPRSTSQSATSPSRSCDNGTYINSAGNTVCRPSTRNSGGATAICADGTYSYSQNRRGTCSHHGGVSRWL